MQRLIYIALSILLLCSSSVTEGECKKIRITLVSRKGKINTHVGNEYSHLSFVNDENMRKGKSFSTTLCKNSSFSILSSSTDSDPVYDDVEEMYQIFYYDDLDIGKYKFEQKVVVTENAGRYSGEETIFTFTYIIYVY